MAKPERGSRQLDLKKLAEALSEALGREVTPAQAVAVLVVLKKSGAVKADALDFSITETLVVEKFDGEYEPGKQPVETVRVESPS